MGKNSAILILVACLMLVPARYFTEKTTESPQHDTAQPAGMFAPVVVLELFTSQGCSSCPPADRLLHELVEKGSPGLFGVSYHVDYWNYIGWEDPFSKGAYTAMQSAYNQKLHSRSNYTPELVINGKEHMVGSDVSGIKERIKAYSRQQALNAISVNVKCEGNEILADYAIEGDTDGLSLKAVLLLDERLTHVSRGENSGRTLMNSQIALAVQEIPLNLPKGTLQFALPGLVRPGESMHLLLMTQNRLRDITGAAQTILPGRN